MNIPNPPPTHWFHREDETNDRDFYALPRFVAHIDQETIDALRNYYRNFLAGAQDVLDLMSSWVSHYPAELTFQRVSGLGMNAEELAHNPQLTDWRTHDLNANPYLPYNDNIYDRVTIAVSIQYLTHPVEVLTDVSRVLRPGGQICIAMSHRLFPTKAIAAFTTLTPQDRIHLVMFYLSESGLEDIACTDCSPPGYDPLWIVTGTA